MARCLYYPSQVAAEREGFVVYDQSNVLGDRVMRRKNDNGYWELAIVAAANIV